MTLISWSLVGLSCCVGALIGAILWHMDELKAEKMRSEMFKHLWEEEKFLNEKV